MPQGRPRFELLLSALFVLALAGGCGSTVTLQSRSTSTPPSVDGALDDWGGSLSYLGNKPVSMSVAPTDSLLYVAVSIQDRGLIRSIVTNGLIVWVDPAGGQKRTYGVRYPLGLRAQRTGKQDASSANQKKRPASALDQVSLSRLAVVWPDSTRRRIPAHFSSGFRADATLDPGALVYEVAIPVGGAPSGTAGRKHGLQASLGRTIGIGLETPQPEDDSDASMPNTGVPSVTGRPGGGRARPGRRRGRRRRRTPQKPQEAKVPQLDLWAKIVTKKQ